MRTQLPMATRPPVLCDLPSSSATAADAGGNGDGGMVPDGDALALAPSSTPADDVRDPETFDDSEFYQQLLKEFLDKGLAAGAWVEGARGGGRAVRVDSTQEGRPACDWGGGEGGVPTQWQDVLAGCEGLE